LVFYMACAHRNVELFGAATLALERVLRAMRAESGSHICARRRYLGASRQYPGQALRPLFFFRAISLDFPIIL
jgi:hypothetical protein